MTKKSIVRFILLSVLIFAGAAGSQALAADGYEDYTMPKKDGRIGDKTVDGPLMFYDMGGPTGSAPGYMAGYVRFVPAAEGSQISISFSEFELTGNAALYIYDGDINFTDYYAEVPSDYIAAVTAGDLGRVFSSTSGSLSVLYHCKGSGSGKGWKAEVQQFVPKAQEWKSVAVSQENLPIAYPGKEGAAIMRVDLLTDGSLNPLTLSQLAFNLSGTLHADKLSNLRVVYSASTDKPSGSVFAQADAPSSALAFAGTQTLRGGHNYFWLLADVAADALPGATLDASLTSATVDGGQKVASPMQADGEVTLANMVLISADHKTYSVGESPISFYDDGGPEGNVTQNFDGSVTFTPASPDKKVQLKFTSLDLFNTSSTGYNDVLKVYNGTSADDANLITSVLKDLVTVHSTSADGALTVSFRSTAGTPKGGFEALVSQFTPVAMAVEEVTATHPSLDDVSAGEEGVDMLLVDVATAGTEPALQLGSMRFSAGGTAPVAKATLYSLGEKADGTPAEVGSVDNPSGSFDITLASPVELREFHNYFLLRFDVGALASQDATLDASVESISCGGAATTATDGNPDGARKINNVVLLTLGSQTKTISGPWKLKAQPASYYEYDYTTGDRRVTLVPNTSGTVMEVDFSKFVVTFPSYSYGSDPSFKIYDGADTSAPVLWSMTKADKDAGPGAPVRATNADGVLTIVFNTQGQRPSTGAGIEADLREYISKPMSVTAVKAFQTNSSVIPTAGTDMEMIGFGITTDGDLNPLQLQEVTVDLKGSQDKVNKVKIYSTGRENSFSTDNLAGSVAVDASKPLQTVALTSPVVLPEKTSYLFVAYDMNDGVESDFEIDAALNSIKVSGAVIPVDAADGDPEGERITKSLVFFDGHSTVNVDKSVLFYDNMGPDGKYTTAAKGTMTFIPSEGKMLRMTVNNFNTFYSEHLYVYDGMDTEGEKLADLAGTSVKEGTVVLSKGESGAMTVEFNPTRDGKNNGWEILVEAFTPVPMAVESVEVTPVNDLKMLRGSADNKMLRAKVTIAGDRGKVNISDFRFSALDTEHEAVTSAKLWCTGTDENFGTFNLFGETLPSDEMTFSGSDIYDAAQTVYYWLSYDISTEAESGSKVQAGFSSMTADGADHELSDLTNALTTVQDGIHGTFTVGASGDYDFPTISDAFASLEPGIDGPVRIEVADGNYRELVTLPAVTGASEKNTITLTSASGNAEKVVITYDRYSDPGSSNYDKRYGVLTLDGIDWFTLENVTVTSGTYTGFPGVVFVRNQSRHCTLRGDIISSPLSTDAAKGTTLVYMYAKNEANSNSDYFTVEGCTLQGGYIGVGLQGTSYVALPKQTGGRIISNRLLNQGSKGIYIAAERDAVVAGNTIVSGTEMTSSYSAMDLYAFEGSLQVYGNSILMDAPQRSATGIYLRLNSNPDLQSARIYNNEVNMLNVTSAVTGLRVNTDIPNLDFVANTISVVPAPEASPAAYGVYFNGSMKGGRFADNIVQNLTAGNALAFNRETYVADGNIPIDTNVIYSANPSKAVYLGGSQADAGDRTFEEWTAKGFDSGSVFEQTEFLSTRVLEPAAKGSLLNASLPDYVTTDLYGAPRDKEHATIGCYEYAESTVAPVMAQSYPAARNIGYETADVAAMGSLTSRVNYIVLPASEAAPTAEDVAASELSFDLRKGVEDVVKLSGLQPKTDYAFYAVLTSLRGIRSEKVYSCTFTTTFRPTVPADFEDARVLDTRIEDGTFSFTGFELADITDGVDPQPNLKAAAMSDEYAVVKLTNADNLPLEGFFLKSTDQAVLTVKDAELAVTATKTLPAAPQWTYVNLRDMGPMTYVEFETEGDLSIDNFGGSPLPLEVKVARDETLRVAEGEETQIPVTVTGGSAPYSYIWTDQQKQQISTEATLSVTPDHSGTYFLTVTDAHGTVADMRTLLLVDGAFYPATFDDLGLAPETWWYAYTDEPDYTSGSFFSGSVGFNNYYNSEWDSWSAFGYSNTTSTSFSSYLTDQYNSAAGHGAGDSSAYGVVYVSNWNGPTLMTLSNTASGESLKGMWITNSAWVVDAIVNGDGMEGKFGEGDWLRLSLTGIGADGSDGQTIETYLADYRAADERDRWYLDTWQWIDLSTLGDVCKVRFDLESTKNNRNGMTTPAYVCIDNVGTGADVTRTPVQILFVNEEEPSATISLQGFFSFDEADGTVEYSMLQESEYAVPEGSQLTVTAPVDAEFTLGLKAVQRGCSEYIEMPVRMQRKELGVDAAVIDGAMVYPNPARDYFTATASGRAVVVDLYSADGLLLQSVKSASGTERIDVSGYAPGAYIVRITDMENGATAVRKLLVVK